MKKEIPHIKFNTASNINLGFEIVPIETIFKNKNKFNHDPEMAHQLKFYNLIYFTEGTGQHFIDFKWYDVQKNNLVYLAKEQITAFKFSENLKGFCIIFTEEHFAKCIQDLPNEFVFKLLNPQLYNPIVKISDDSEFEGYFKLIQKESDSINSFNQKAILDALFIILLSKTERLTQNNVFESSDSSKISIFQNFVSLLAKHFTEHKNAEYYARQLAISYKHLNTCCKESINKTAKQVITDFIILQAKRNLINSKIKSTELAYKLGFEDPTNFTKYFKKYTELTPNSFKKTYSK